MGSRGVSLDSAPPPPPGIGQQQPNLGSMSGKDQQQSDPSLQSSVIQKLAMADQIMQEAAQIMPTLAPIMADIRQQMKAKAGGVIFKQGAAPQQPPTGLASLIQTAAPQMTPTS